MADRFDEMARAVLSSRIVRSADGDAEYYLSTSNLAALLRKVHDEAQAEADRLRKLFDDAGQGEHNVLALVDHYQRTAMEADDRFLAARKVVEAARVGTGVLIAHLTAQLAHAEADAEQAIHNEAFKEAQRIAEWLRTTSRAKGVLISIHSSQDIARLADDVASMSYREPT